MKHPILLLIVPALFYFSCSQIAGNKKDVEFNPPATIRIPVTDTYFGMEVTDNYRWLENVKDSSVFQWLKAQSDYTNIWLDKIPGRDSLVAEFVRLDALVPAEIRNITRKADRYFFRKTLPGEKTGKLYYRDGKNGNDVLLYDPGFDKDSVPYSINTFVPSEDGSKVALLISKGGAEVSHLYVLKVATKKLYPDDIFPCRFNISWSPDNKGPLYLLMNGADTHSMEALKNSRTMYHLVGNDPSQDKEIFSRRKYPHLDIKERDICMAKYTGDFKYLIAFRNTVSPDIICYYAPATDLLKPHIDWKPLLQKEDHVTRLAFDGDDVYMKTYNDAPNNKIIKSNLNHFSVANAKTIISEGNDHIIYLDRSKDYLFITYNDGINSTAKQYNLHTGQLAPVNLPLTGTGVLVPYDIQSNDGLILLTSWKQPVTLYDYNADIGEINESAFNIRADYPGINDIEVVETEVKAMTVPWFRYLLFTIKR